MPRRYGWSGPAPRDWTKPTYRIAAPTRVTHVDRLSLAIPIRDQGDEGACTGFGSTRAIQTAVGGDVLSPQFCYFNGRVAEATQDSDSGAAVGDVVAQVMAYGAAAEAVYPYVAGEYAQRPTLDAYADAAGRKGTLAPPQAVRGLQGLKHALAAGLPVVFGFSVPAFFESAKMETTGFLPMPGTFDRFLGGHCVVADGFDDRGPQPFVWVANSWGTSWGPFGGWFKMAPGWFDSDLVDDAWALSKA